MRLYRKFKTAILLSGLAGVIAISAIAQHAVSASP